MAKLVRLFLLHYMIMASVKNRNRFFEDAASENSMTLTIQYQAEVSRSVIPDLIRYLHINIENLPKMPFRRTA